MVKVQCSYKNGGLGCQCSGYQKTRAGVISTVAITLKKEISICYSSEVLRNVLGSGVKTNHKTFTLCLIYNASHVF